MKKTILALSALISISAIQPLSANKKKNRVVATQNNLPKTVSEQSLFQFYPAPNLTLARTCKLMNYWTLTGISIEGMYCSVLAGSHLGGWASAVCYLVGIAGFIDNFFDAFYVEPKENQVNKKH